MRERIVRVGLALMVVSSAVIGAWAQLAPHSFYTSFPGGGRHWVNVDGPFNEHLIRDVGGLNLGLAAVALVALLVMTRPLIVAATIAPIVYGVPHLAYHATHLDPYGTSDAVANVVSLSVAVVLPAVVLVAGLGRRETTTGVETTSATAGTAAAAART